MPHYNFIGGVAEVVEEESWLNRTQARADARNTTFVNLDPLNDIAANNIYTRGPRAVRIRENAFGNDWKILLAHKGHLCLLDDDGGPNDPIEFKQGWTLVHTPGHYHNLIPLGTDGTRALYVTYGRNNSPSIDIGGGIAAGSSSAYCHAYEIELTGPSSFSVGIAQTMGKESGANPVTGWSGWSVHGRGVIAHKQMMGYIGDGKFIQVIDAGAPAASGNEHYMSVFSWDDRQGPEWLERLGGGNAAFPDSGLYGGNLPRYGQGVCYDEQNAGAHVMIGGYLNFIEADANNQLYTASAHWIDLSAFVPNGDWTAAIDRLQVGLVYIGDGRIVFSVGGFPICLEFDPFTGYSIVDYQASAGLYLGQSNAFELGLFTPCTGNPSDTTHTNQGGNDQQHLQYMGIKNSNKEIVSLAIGSTSTNGGYISSRTTGLDGADSFLPKNDIVENVGVVPSPDSCSYNTQVACKKDDDTIYVFHSASDGGLIVPYGAIIRK